MYRKGYDCFLIDFGGRQYVDFQMGSGANLLGHSFLKNSGIDKIIGDGISYKDSMESNELKDRISTLYEGKVILCSTGSEAVEKAIRACRAYTGQTKIAMFSGSWHGSYDSLLFQEDWSVPRWPPSWRTHGHNFHVPLPISSVSTGISNNDDIDIYPYNSKFTKFFLEKNIQDYAAVVIEPIQGSNPREDVSDFLHSIKELTSFYHTPLIFDEIITGFRCGLKGVQALYDIKPTITTLGKVVGGGFPIGVIVGDDEILNTDGVYYGGTYADHPISCAAGNVVLDYLSANPTIYEELYNLTENIVDTIAAELVDYPVQIMKCHSFFRIVFTDKRIDERRDRADYEDYSQVLKFRDILKHRGVLIGTNGLFFVCPEHKYWKSKFIAPIIHAVKDTFGESYKL